MRLWPQGSLWRHRDFLKLWSAETISQFGTAITGLALPLVAIIVLHASAFEVAALATIEFAPFILFSLPAGVWVDRLRRRPILIAGDLGRALLLASIPIVYFADALTIWQLYVVGFLVGTLTVFFDVAYQSYLPSLVERGDLVEGNSKLEVSRSCAQIAGPGFAGAIIGLLTAPYAILLDAVSFFGSALLLFGIRKQEGNPSGEGTGAAERRSMRAELGEGLRFVLGHRYLRSIAASTATFNFFGNMFGAIFLVYLVRRLHWSPALIGLTGSLASTGALLGALTANRIAGRIGVGRAIVWSQAASVVGILIPLAPQDKYRAIPYLVVAEFVIAAAIVIYNVNQLSLRQALCPERLQGRMNAVMRFLVWGTIPLGNLIGGALASTIGLRPTIWIGVLGSMLAALPVALSPVRSVERIPEQVEEIPAFDPLVADAVALTVEPPGV
jgi:MFS family permease